ncbi:MULTISPECIES: NFACT family protein [unclassified Helicobacter]|uniref:NFACT family protein n=1 Tax=unclassified Helicobacter TaxID=2593540 RepID=UPI000CF0C6DA|nr:MULTISPECIES: NFACT family protein [unclassified Helicobacter]
MKLELLQNIANLFKNYSQINSLRRIQDNLFKLQLHQDFFYLDMQKYQSNIFITDTNISNKTYQAPFDLMLQKLTTRARLLDCYCDGNNRILILYCKQNHLYKDFNFFIYFEFTGKHTNVILLNQEHIVLEALRHLNHTKTSREVRPNHALLPLPQREGNFTPVAYSKEQILKLLNQNYFSIMEKKIAHTKEILLRQLEKKLEKYKTLIQNLPKPQDLQNQSQKLNQEATLLLSNLHLIKPFDTQVTLKDFNQNEIKIQIPQTGILPQDYINSIFTQSKKLSKRAKNIYIEEQNLQDKINFIQQKIAFITQTSSLENITILKPAKQSKLKEQKFESFYIENYKISIGKNQDENQMLLEVAKANDIWLHIRNIPSSHMIIHCGKNKPSLSIIQKAGEILVGLNSITKGNFEVDYTLRKFVKIKEKANVVYAKYQTISYKK